jgi:rRNA maturation endonuclease Nob1
MTIAIGLLMVIAAAAYVAAPFFTSAAAPESAGPKPVTASERERLERQKLDAYAAIKELEFDYRMHKLSDADFAAIRDKYAAQAVEAIAALDAAKAAQPRQVAEGRRLSHIAFCPSCGVSVPARARFCPACGRSLREEAVA